MSLACKGTSKTHKDDDKIAVELFGASRGSRLTKFAVGLTFFRRKFY